MKGMKTNMRNKLVVVSKTFIGKYPICYLEERKTEEKSYIYYHYDRKTEQYITRTLIMLEALYVNHLINDNPDLLQNLMNNGKLYLDIERRVRRAEKAVENQLNKWCSEDKEFQSALSNSKFDKCDRLERNLKARAEETIYPDILYI